MSGHSKWHKIKRAKEATDKKKSTAFGKLAREIVTSARGNADPEKNPSLRDAIARAKKANMPQANIDRLLSKEAGKAMEEVTYEAYGPGGYPLLIICITDNSNRTVADVRTALKKHGGTLGTPGSVRWQFDDELTVKHPVELTRDNKDKLNDLKDELHALDDVAQIYPS